MAKKAKRTMICSAITLAIFLILATLACVTRSPAESIRNYQNLTETAGVCPSTDDYLVLTNENIEIAGEITSTISYSDRRVTVTSSGGTWTSGQLLNGPVRFTTNIALQDGRQFNVLFEGVICEDSILYMLPPDITPLSNGKPESQDIIFPDPCTLSYVTCPGGD